MTAIEFGRVEPAVRERPGGDYFAASPPGSSLSIGVTGGTEAEARTRFYEARAAWIVLSEAPTESFAKPS